MGCRGERRVVLDFPDAGAPPPPISSCDGALRGSEGDACVDFEPECIIMTGCCVRQFICEINQLFIFEDCGLCAECSDDRECGAQEWCIGISTSTGTCTPCPERGPCEDCPPDLVPLIRNGCETCECLPPTQCRNDEECMERFGDRGPFCLPGQLCACDDISCCVNVCMDPSCTPPTAVPEGCVVDCPDMSCELGCRLQGCRCVDDRWECSRRCAESPEPRCDGMETGMGP